MTSPDNGNRVDPGNQFFGEGASLIGEALSMKRFQVTNLDLSGNAIGNQAAGVLADAIKANTTLQVPRMPTSAPSAVVACCFGMRRRQWQ